MLISDNETEVVMTLQKTGDIARMYSTLACWNDSHPDRQWPAHILTILEDAMLGMN